MMPPVGLTPVAPVGDPSQLGMDLFCLSDVRILILRDYSASGPTEQQSGVREIGPHSHQKKPLSLVYLFLANMLYEEEERNGESGSAEETIRTIKCKTRKYSGEEKIRIVVEGLRGEESIAAFGQGWTTQ